jgi:hypothetical protein
MTYRETRAQELGETVTVTVRQPEPEPELGSGLEAGKQTDRLCFTYLGQIAYLRGIRSHTR